MGSKHTISAVLWAANAVVWGGVYIIDRNLKSERRRVAGHPKGLIKVDLSGDEPIQLAYQKKMIPEFTIYQV
jgi:hypothetical protein